MPPFRLGNWTVFLETCRNFPSILLPISFPYKTLRMLCTNHLLLLYLTLESRAIARSINEPIGFKANSYFSRRSRIIFSFTNIPQLFFDILLSAIIRILKIQDSSSSVINLSRRSGSALHKRCIRRIGNCVSQIHIFLWFKNNINF